MAQPNVHRSLALALSFFMSFCGIAYQQAMALTLSDATGEFVLCQALCLGFFLLGMGLGAWRAERALGTWREVARVELWLSVLGLVSVTYIQGSEVLLRGFLPGVHELWLLVLALPFVGLLGFLTGFEIPLLLKWTPGVSSGTVLGWNYFGAVFASATVPLILLPHLDTFGVAHIAAILNALLALLIIWRFSRGLREQTFALLLLLGFAGWMQVEPAWRGFYMKAIYLRPSFQGLSGLKDRFTTFQILETPLRLRTPYQWIDVLGREVAGAFRGDPDFFLYMDRKLQIRSGGSTRYHESFADGAVNLLGRTPRKILILGGGDGALLPELLKYPGVIRVDLVELDAEMLQLARTHSELRALNGGMLDDPRVHVHTGDAFSFVRSTREKFDLILSDLPFPNSYDLSLLFSKEFFALVHARLQPGGVFVFDFPSPQENFAQLGTIALTLGAAGFQQPLAYGAYDMFIAAAADNRRLVFNFEQVFKQISNPTLLNMLSRRNEMHLASASRDAKVNSILFPYRFDEERTAKESDVGRVVSSTENPGFLPLFLERFRVFHAHTFAGSAKAWPEQFWLEWKDDFKDDRDFSENFRGVVWPRFQWTHTVTESGVDASSITWFDTKYPERLRERWRRIHGRSLGGEDWVGVTWNMNSGVMIFHSEAPGPQNAAEEGVSPRLQLNRQILRREFMTPGTRVGDNLYFP